MNLHERSYSHIIWDWNGTLLNDAWLCVDVMNGMLRERHLPERTMEQYRDIFDFPVKDYYAQLGFDFNQEPFEIVGMDFVIRYNERQKETSLHAEVPKVLQSLSDRGFRQYILSAREQSELITETRELGVFGFFDRIFGLDDHYAHGKTDVGHKLIKTIGVPREVLLFIGDTRHDAEVAKEIGIDCILIPNGHHSPERLGGFSFPVIPSLTELIHILCG